MRMVSIFSVRIFRLGILDYVSRRFVYFGNFPFGQTKIRLRSQARYEYLSQQKSTLSKNL